MRFCVEPKEVLRLNGTAIDVPAVPGCVRKQDILKLEVAVGNAASMKRDHSFNKSIGESSNLEHQALSNIPYQVFHFLQALDIILRIFLFMIL